MMIFPKIETMELLFHHSMTLLGVPTKVKSKYFVTTLHLFGYEPATHDWSKTFLIFRVHIYRIRLFYRISCQQNTAVKSSCPGSSELRNTEHYQPYPTFLLILLVSDNILYCWNMTCIINHRWPCV